MLFMENNKANKKNENSKKEMKDKKKTTKDQIETEELKNKIKQLETEVENTKNDYLRTLADFDNYRKRKEKEILETRDRAISDFVISLLPAIDNFEMSLKMTENTQMFVKGVEMIHKNLIDTLKEHKFEEFEPQIGESFDPYQHDPVIIEESEIEPGKIAGILKKGYKHKDKIIRPARVHIPKEKEENNN